MQFCGKCGAQMQDGAPFCPKCGAPMAGGNAGRGAAPVNPGNPVSRAQGGYPGGMNQGNMNPGGMNPNAQPAGFPMGGDMGGKVNNDPGLSSFDQSVNYISSTGARGFVSEDETILYSLKNGNIGHVISGRGWVSDDAIITDKRLYYSCSVGLITKIKDEQIVDIDDITGTKIRNRQPLIFIILAVLFLIAGAIGATEEGAIFAVGLVAALIMLVLYFFNRDAILSVEYAGGFIDFRVKYYGMDKVRAFQRCIYAAKELRKKKTR